MVKEQIKSIIEKIAIADGMTETGIDGVKIFRVSHPVECAPAIYEPAIIALLSGEKEAILGGNSYKYNSDLYMCCSMPMPVEAGTPTASIDKPLLGVYISLDTKVMTELSIEIESEFGNAFNYKNSNVFQGLSLARWDATFSDSLLRLLQLEDNKTDATILGHSRLRELYYSVLKGDAGASVRRAFNIGNEISRTIEYLSVHIKDTITIDDMATHAGMSRAVFHRKFKEATMMSPIQFIKAMRLNRAAMNIATGMNVSQAASEVGYISSSQFSREFKRIYGQSPKQWSKGTLS